MQDAIKYLEALPTLFVELHKLKNEAGLPIEFDSHYFMRDLYDDFSPLQVWLKPPQIGATVAQIIKTFYAAKKKGWDIIYTLPTESDVHDMAGGKINRLLAQNPVLLNWVKDHDTVEQKSVGENIIYYRGTFTAKQAMMVSSDLNVHDEVDACYEPDTEILTKSGWKKVQDISYRDKVCTLNPTNHSVVWQYPTDIFSQPYHKEMYRFIANSIDFAVTENHKMWAKTRAFSGFQGRGNPYALHAAKDLFDKSFVMTSKGRWRHYGKDDGLVSIPGWQTKKNYKNVYFKAKKVNKMAFYEFMGWYLTEGSVRKTRTSKNRQRANGVICITQKNQKEIELIVDCIHRLGYEPKLYKNKRGVSSIEFSDRHLALFLQSLGYCDKKYLPDQYLYERKPYLEAFLNAAILGDGDDRNVITTQSKRLADCYQTVALQLGFTASIYFEPNARVYRVGLYKRAPFRRFNGFRRSTSKGTVRKEQYNGIVYCLTVPNHIMMVRGKNKKMPLWSGNSNTTVINQYETRLQAKADGRRWYFSHPSDSGRGVDLYWQQSDKKEWFIYCNHCGHYQQLKWPDNIDLKERRYRCQKCDKTLSNEARKYGIWQATSKGVFSGYHISQLMCSWISADKILLDFEHKDKQYFYNYVLGYPYVSSDNKISAASVLANCTDRINTMESRPIIGVDSGLPIHYVVMNKEGVFFYDTCEKWSTIEALLIKWPNAILVGDQGGDLIGIRDLQERYPGRVFLAFYRKDKKSKEMIKWGENQDFGVVTVDRNRMIQMIVDQMKERNHIYLNGPRDEWKEFADHFEHIFRVKNVTDKIAESGVEYDWYYEWQRNGADHFVHALLYALVGLDKYAEQHADILSPHPLMGVLEGTGDGARFRDMSQILGFNRGEDYDR